MVVEISDVILCIQLIRDYFGTRMNIRNNTNLVISATIGKYSELYIQDRQLSEISLLSDHVSSSLLIKSTFGWNH